MIKARDLEAGVETSQEYEQRTRVEFWLRRATDLEQQLARVTADRDAARLELGEMKQQERVQVRQLRAENDCLRRALDDQAEQLRAQRAWTSAVTSDSERSQLQNTARCMEQLRDRLAAGTEGER